MPGLALAGRIVSRFGNLHGLRIGALSSCVSFALAGRARTWLDFSAAAVCGSFAMTSYSAQSALAMIEGKAVGFQQGELQPGPRGVHREAPAANRARVLPQERPRRCAHSASRDSVLRV